MAFYILLSATPMPNEISDIKGFLKLIQRKDAGRLWMEDTWIERGIKANTSPYTVPDDHPAAILRMTAKAADKQIFSSTVNPHIQGAKLAMVLRRCLIGRSYTSQTWLAPSPMIRQSVPRVQSLLLLVISCLKQKTNTTRSKKVSRKR